MFIKLLLALPGRMSGLDGVIMRVEEATAFNGDCMLSLRLSSSDIKSLFCAGGKSRFSKGFDLGCVSVRSGSGLTSFVELRKSEMGFGSSVFRPPGVEWLVGSSVLVWLYCCWALLSICMMSWPVLFSAVSSFTSIK